MARVIKAGFPHNKAGSIKSESLLPAGPWTDEPDSAEWVDHKTGLRCFARRNGMKAWCGYVTVPKYHPAYGLGYSEPLLSGITVHGGLTFAGPSEQLGDKKGKPYWLVGFDCAHCYDLCPVQLNGVAFPCAREATYRTLDYVKDECRSLAAALHAMDTPMAELARESEA